LLVQPALDIYMYGFAEMVLLSRNNATINTHVKTQNRVSRKTRASVQCVTPFTQQMTEFDLHIPLIAGDIAAYYSYGALALLLH